MSKIVDLHKDYIQYHIVNILNSDDHINDIHKKLNKEIRKRRKSFEQEQRLEINKRYSYQNSPIRDKLEKNYLDTVDSVSDDLQRSGTNVVLFGDSLNEESSLRWEYGEQS